MITRFLRWLRSFASTEEQNRRFSRVDLALDGYVHGDGVCDSPYCPWCS